MLDTFVTHALPQTVTALLHNTEYKNKKKNEIWYHKSTTKSTFPSALVKESNKKNTYRVYLLHAHRHSLLRDRQVGLQVDALRNRARHRLLKSLLDLLRAGSLRRHRDHRHYGPGVRHLDLRLLNPLYRLHGCFNKH